MQTVHADFTAPGGFWPLRQFPSAASGSLPRPLPLPPLPLPPWPASQHCTLGRAMTGHWPPKPKGSAIDQPLTAAQAEEADHDLTSGQCCQLGIPDNSSILE